MNEFATERNKTIFGMIEAKKAEIDELSSIVSEFKSLKNSDFTDYDHLKIGEALSFVQKASRDLANARHSIRTLLG